MNEPGLLFFLNNLTLQKKSCDFSYKRYYNYENSLVFYFIQFKIYRLS